MNYPQTLALDFDGVLCNGLREYFQTTWRTYRQLWPTSTPTPSDSLPQVFYRLRPVVETGWEMPVLLRAIVMGFPEEEILHTWTTIRDRVVRSEDLNPQSLADRVDHVRDHWLRSNLHTWLEEHEFYQGVVPRLQALDAQGLPWVIITTKESRFVMALLTQVGINLPADRLFGKDSDRPKAETLRALIQHMPRPIWFVEDRLQTLINLKTQADLAEVELFLGAWGYNTPDERHNAAQDERIHLLSLARFCRDFSAWMP